MRPTRESQKVDMIVHYMRHCLCKDFNVNKATETILTEADISYSKLQVIYSLIFVFRILRVISGIETNTIFVK